MADVCVPGSWTLKWLRMTIVILTLLNKTFPALYTALGMSNKSACTLSLQKGPNVGRALPAGTVFSTDEDGGRSPPYAS
jgi:hypothetical protein